MISVFSDLVDPQRPQEYFYVPQGEAVLFFILAPLIVIAACGLLFAKKAVHAALCMAFVMISLAVLYAAQGAQFLFAAQILVYTGAVMMLFLFVLMLVGVDRDESIKETIGSHRIVTAVVGLGMLTVMVGSVTGLYGALGRLTGFTTQPVYPYIKQPPKIDLVTGAEETTTNPVQVARLVFSDFVVPLELVGTLLISAAVGAIVLTHRERLTAKVTQRESQAQRVKSGSFVAGLPAPGVFAQHNSTDTPALLPDGSFSEASVSRVLKARGQDKSGEHLGEDVAERLEDLHVTDTKPNPPVEGSK